MCTAGFFVVIIFFLIKTSDVVNVGNNSYHTRGINTSLKGSLLSYRARGGSVVVFQVEQLGRKHAIEPVALLHQQRAPQPFSNHGWEDGLVLSPETSVFPERKTHLDLKQVQTLDFFAVMIFSSITETLVTKYVFKLFSFQKLRQEMTKMLMFPFVAPFLYRAEKIYWAPAWIFAVFLK